MSTQLESAKLNMWRESLKTSYSSFFGVFGDVIHVIILTSFLTQDSVGIFFLSYAFLYLFAQIPRGIGIAVRKRASEINTDRSKYLWIGLFLILPILSVSFGLLVLGQPVLNSYSSVTLSYSVLQALFFATVGFAVLEFARYYIAGCSEPGLAEKLRTFFAKPSLLLLTTGFLWYDSTVEMALYAVFIAYFSTACIMFVIGSHQWIKPEWNEIVDILKFSKWSLLTSLLNDFYHRWDTILLSIMATAAALTYYESSVRLAFLATTLAMGISKTSNVKMSGLIEADSNIQDIAEKTFVASTFLIFPALLVFIFNAEYILKILFGSEYTGGSLFLIMMGVTQLLQCYRVQFEAIFNSLDQPGKTTKTSVIAVIVNVLTAPVLVLQFGGLGVLYSTILSELVRMVVYEIQVKQEFGDFIKPTGVFTQYISFGFSALIVYLIQLLFDLSNIQLIIISLCSISVFYIIQYKLSSETRSILRQYRSEKTA